jgi:signal transduction histidine kinase/ActR/RegA family two-component response regulator
MQPNLGTSLHLRMIRGIVPLYFALAAAVGMMLVWLYISAVFGGRAWISASNRGAVTQSLEMTRLEGEHCLRERALNGGPVCSPTTTVPARTSATNAQHGREHASWQQTVKTPTLIIRALGARKTPLLLGGKPLELTTLEAAARAGKSISAFAVINGRAVHVVMDPDKLGDLIAIRDVTDVLLYRIAAAGAVEVDLIDGKTGHHVAGTWRNLAGEAIAPLSAGLERNWLSRTVTLPEPYLGYSSVSNGQIVNFAEGETEFGAFAATHTAPSVAGYPTVKTIISVPDSVMLLYAQWAVAFFLVVTGGIFFATIIRVRSLSRQHLRPIERLAGQVRELSASLSLKTDNSESLLDSDSSTEVVALQYAVRQLRQEMADNAHLEQRLRQREKMEAIGYLAGGIAHDFNNLLNIITVGCSFLKEDTDDPSLRESVDDIALAASRATELTRGLLAFGRQEDDTTTDARDLVAEFTANTKMIGRIIGPDVTLHIDAPAVAYGTVSTIHMQQVLMNLIINARDALTDARGNVRVSLSIPTEVPSSLLADNTDSPAKWLLFRVADDGKGMSEEMLARVFDPFYTTKAEGSGTGLGLSVVRDIVEANGGHVAARSEVGVGSTFEVYFLAATPKGESNRHHSDMTIDGMSVLLIDDNESVRTSLTSMLQRLGCRVHGHGDGQAALAWLEQQDVGAVDLLVTDIQMPGLDGYEVANACRTLLPHMPILFVTGFDPEAGSREKLPNSGLLHKPIDPDVFLGAAWRLTRSSQTEQESVA